MIRKFKQSDSEEVSQLWLASNIDSHEFIDSNYWSDNLTSVKEMFLDAEIYVYDDQGIKGFIGFMDSYLAGIFIESKSRSLGFGKKLLDFGKSIKNTINLSVYKKNVGAYNFYRREGFVVSDESIDEATGEIEYLMEYIQE